MIGSSALSHEGLGLTPRVLIPFDAREAVTTDHAAMLAGRTERTIRNWCSSHHVGRRVRGGPWWVSRIALMMLVEDDERALRAYLAGDRTSPSVTAYFVAAGLGDLIERWRCRQAA